MTNKFPTKKILKFEKYYSEYISKKNFLLKKIDLKELKKIINQIIFCTKRNNIIYTCGNGGSSSLADHFTCDFFKQTNNKTNLKIKSISLSSNFSLISAISNDISYDDIYSFQIEKLCKKNDLIFIFSVSGNSKNLIKAAKAAKKKNSVVISLTGFNGGKLRKLSDFNLNFNINNYGIVEDCHITIMHYLSQFVRNLNINKNTFNNINF